MNINAENCQEDEEYQVYLVKDDQGEIKEYHLGRLITDERGRTQTSIDLNLIDLESKGFSIEQIDAILIRKGIYVLLGGYIDRDKGTIDRYIKDLFQEGGKSTAPNIAQGKDEKNRTCRKGIEIGR